MRHYLLLLVAFFGLFSAPTPVIAQTNDEYAQLFRDFSADGLSYADKRFLQTALAFEGHYNGLLDGDWGALSQAALDSFARREFGTSAEEWHMAVLAIGFFEIYDRDGWAIRYFEPLNMSMLYPFEAITNDPPTDKFVNWRHQNSSLAYSVGLHSRATVQRLHNYTAEQHNSRAEPYDLRRTNFAITTATQSDGSVLYTRSNYTRGEWSTVMLSADRRDVPILNAVAASLDVGFAPGITLTDGGRLATAVLQSAELANESERAAKPQSSPVSAIPSPSIVSGSGTGFIVSADGHTLTNAHVISGCDTLQIDGHLAEVVAVSEEFDLALIKADGWFGDGIATFSPAPAKLNSDVTVVGYPLAGILSGLNVTRGAVSSQLGFRGEATRMQITAPVQPGNSGGPVLAADGEVVGVVVSKLDAQVVAEATGDIPQNVNFAIRGEIAKLFLFQNGIDPVLGTSDERESPVDLAERASDFTAFIECN